MARASDTRRRLISSTDCPSCAAEANAFFMRSMAQNRLTAVGRVPAIRSQDFWNSVVNCLVPVARLRIMPTAIPIAAATPIAGAPRMTMVLIAFATSFAVLHVTYTSDAGSLRWSIITTASSFHSIVGSIRDDDISQRQVKGQRAKGKGEVEGIALGKGLGSKSRASGTSQAMACRVADAWEHDELAA